MQPRINPGSITAGAMLFGILFGWGVLALTRIEARDAFADVGERLDTLDSYTEMLVERVDMTTNLAGRPQKQPVFPRGGRSRADGKRPQEAAPGSAMAAAAEQYVDSTQIYPGPYAVNEEPE